MCAQINMKKPTSFPRKTKCHIIRGLHMEPTFHNQEFVNTEKNHLRLKEVVE